MPENAVLWDMTVDLKELERVVLTLNNEAYDQTVIAGRTLEEGLEPFEFIVSGVGGVQAITIFDQVLWDSESDERKYTDTGTEENYEPLEGYVRRVAQEWLKVLSTIKLHASGQD
jgi:hypothetical protein